MNRSQRIILVIAAAALALVLERAIFVSSMDGGWFGYAPNSGEVFAPEIEVRRQVLARLGLLIAWTLLSLRLLREDGRTRTGADR